MSGREFFTARTVAEARSGFRPAHRTAVRTVPLAEALHRVPAGPVPATAALPGFDRSTRFWLPPRLTTSLPRK